jgi:DNA-binding response OmpR family regulator
MKGWHEKANEYLTKPFDVSELNIRIKSLLDIRNLFKQRFSDNILNSKLNVNSNDIAENKNTLFIENLNGE